MALKKGERYECPECGCEIEVTRGSDSNGGDENPRCCCGQEMTQAQRQQKKQQAKR